MSQPVSVADVTPTIVAGAFAGSVALVVFVTVHAIWIVPIWAMLSMLPVAALVGALAAWPFEAIAQRGAVPAAPFDGLAYALMLLATLMPAAVFGAFAGPVDREHISASAVLVPLLLAAPAGAAMGGAMAGSSGALALSLAALALALTLGHNLPFFPIGSYGWEKAFTLVASVELAGGAAFTVARALLASSLSVAAR